jgi:hypothetical protein
MLSNTSKTVNVILFDVSVHTFGVCVCVCVASFLCSK